MNQNHIPFPFYKIDMNKNFYITLCEKESKKIIELSKNMTEYFYKNTDLPFSYLETLNLTTEEAEFIIEYTFISDEIKYMLRAFVMYNKMKYNSNTKIETFAFSYALALESASDARYEHEEYKFTDKELYEYAKIVAYKVAHNLSNGFKMDKNDDPLTSVDCNWISDYEYGCKKECNLLKNKLNKIIPTVIETLEDEKSSMEERQLASLALKNLIGEE